MALRMVEEIQICGQLLQNIAGTECIVEYRHVGLGYCWDIQQIDPPQFVARVEPTAYELSEMFPMDQDRRRKYLQGILKDSEAAVASH